MDTVLAAGVRPPRRVQVSRQTLLAVGIMVVLAAVATVAGLPMVHGAAYLSSPRLSWWALALGFVAAETCVQHLQGRREAQTFSLSEIPLVLGLFLATPAELLLGQAIGYLFVLAFVRRSPAVKVAFNTLLHAAEAAVAIVLFRGITAGLGGAQVGSWLATYAAIFVVNAFGLVAIGCIIAVYEGGLRVRSLPRAAVVGQATAPMAITFALISVAALATSPLAMWLILGFGVLMLLAYRSYAALADRHLNLDRLYRFSQAVTSAPETDAVLAQLLGEARELLRADGASAVFVSPEGGVIARVRLGPSGHLNRSQDPPSPEDAWVLEHVVDGTTPLLMPRGTRDQNARAWLARYGLRDAVAVPLRGATGVVGILVACDRSGDVRTFERDDVLLLETVANHASVALRNGELIGQLRHEALHDALTGLPNRKNLQRRLAEALDDVAAARVAGAAVMILDLDDFKEVNDTLGHQQGDQLLVEVAARLAAAVGDSGTVARLGGDEFAVLLPGIGDEEPALRVGRRVLRALEQPVVLDGFELEVGGSVGVALAPVHALDAAALLKAADLAMYDAKTSTHGVRLFQPQLDTTTPRRLTLVSELRAALQDGGVGIHVQPLARPGSGQVVGVEALARWTHPELGEVTPDEFIPIAERTGLILPLTSQVLDAALAACAQWHEAGHELGIAVNLSTRSLHDADLVDEVARLLRRHQVPPQRLTLEVTESSVMADPARAVALLHRLRDLGVRLSVDDFGTGYSSLSYLKRLPVHEVKIDRSFVTGLREGGEDIAIVRAIIDLGHHLGLEVVAEGVEDEQTWQLLAALGCDIVQGWHVARPMPTGELLPWLRAHTPAVASGRTGLRVV